MSLCLAAGALVVLLNRGEIVLAWRHSVQKTRWEEVWRETPAGMRLVEARIESSGAGMDPPDGARLEGGFWRWTPTLPALREVVLRRSGATADYSLCEAATCRPMSDFLPPEADPVTLRSCG